MSTTPTDAAAFDAPWHVVERDSDLHVEALPDGPHVCNVGRATWLGVRETAQRIVDDHNRAVAWRAASATAPVALAADELAAIGARAVTYERAAQAYATASHGAPSRVRRLEMEDAAHDSAADVPALLAHIAALDALRHGADPDAATLPTRSREVTDRWGYD